MNSSKVEHGMNLKTAAYCGLGVAVGGLILLATMLLLQGCTLLGANAKGPTRFEEALWNTTNVPMVTVHTLTNVVTVTNEVRVPKEEVHIETVTVTNTVGVPVVQTQFVTNTVTVTNQVVAQQTNVIPAGSIVQVPQFTSRTGTGDAIVGVGGAVGGVWGLGAIAAAVLSGGLNWWQRNRNLALAASYTGANQTATAARQAGATLVQQIEVLMEVLKTTPQGQQVLPAVKGFLKDHQLQTDTIATVAQLVKANVDNEAAREAAGDILQSVDDLRGLIASDAARPAPDVAGKTIS